MSLLKQPAPRQLIRCCQVPLVSSPWHRISSKESRRYGTRRKVAAGGNSFACTWLTKTPGDVTPDDVLSSISSIPSPIVDEQHVPVLLVTTSFASWVDTTGPFLSQWMDRLYAGSHLPGPFNVIAAVVDKLPDVSTNSETSGPAATDPTPPFESEGLSLLLVRSENIQVKSTPPRRIRGPQPGESAFIFAAQGKAIPTADNTAYRPTHEIGLCLAETLFVNGHTNTLIGMHWARDSGSAKLLLKDSAHLSTCNITSTARATRNLFELPLHPVSQRRQVVLSMGNILNVVTGASDEDTMPASAELEKVLPRYIEENDFAEPLVDVWALVEKPEVDPPVETDKPQERIARSLRGGGKLYRILSGGGGWGKKQGLLSLDPDRTLSDATRQEGLVPFSGLFGPDEPMPEFPLLSDDGIVIDDLNMLTQAASKGDYVQFFASLPPSTRSVQSERLDLSSADLSYCFGVALEQGEDDGGLAVDSTRYKDLTIVPNFFGALSHKAITYLQPVVRANPDGEMLESRTKIDLPGSRVSLLLEQED